MKNASNKLKEAVKLDKRLFEDSDQLNILETSFRVKYQKFPSS
jgi:hypothetical protein